jgi:hypothetical protein
LVYKKYQKEMHSIDDERRGTTNAPTTKRRNKNLLVEPTQITCYYNHHIHTSTNNKLTNFEIQHSIHSCPLLIRDTMKRMFPDIDLKQLIIVPLIQPHNEFEQENLTMFVRAFTQKLKLMNIWCDFVIGDGYAVLSKGREQFSEQDVYETLLRINLVEKKLYTGTLFTTANLETVKHVIDEIISIRPCCCNY